MQTEFQKYLRKLGACQDAREWAGDRTARRAWDESPRADWLLWWAGKVSVDRKVLVWTACRCARTAFKFVKAGEDRPRLAIEAAEAWTRGETTIEQVRASATDAANAAADAAASAASAANAYSSSHLQMCEIVRGLIEYPGPKDM